MQGKIYILIHTFPHSPEVWKDEPYSFKSDMWSMGCVLYEMITLQPPFTADDMQGLYRRIVKGYYKRIPKQYTQDLAYVVKWLLQVKPENRPSCDQLITLPIFARRVEKHFPDGSLDMDNSILLKTIKVPNSKANQGHNYFLTYLSDKLPKPSYNLLEYDNENYDRTDSYLPPAKMKTN